MAAPSLLTIKEKASLLTEVRTDLDKHLREVKGSNGQGFDFTKPLSSVDRSLTEIDGRVILITGLLSGVDGTSDTTLVPSNAIIDLSNAVDQLIAQYRSVRDQLANVGNNGGPGPLDPSSFVLRSGNGQAALKLQGGFQQVWNLSDNLLSAYYRVVPVIAQDETADFSGLVRSFGDVRNTIEALRVEIDDLAKQSRLDRQNIADIKKKVINAHEDLGRLKSEAEKDRKNLGEYAAEGTTKIAEVRKVHEQSELLRVAADKYKATFDNFQAALDKRELDLQAGSQLLQDLTRDLAGERKRIETLRKEAESMLSGATVAGLAGEFGKLRDKLSKEVDAARRAFYASIISLVIAVMPLVFFVFPAVGAALGLPASVGGQGVHAEGAIQLFVHILARALLLVPAAWFAKFAASRHAQLFRLKEHYAYKCSVAASVEGFKKQAEPFKDAIAAATFLS